MSVFQRLPQNIKNFLQEGYQESTLMEMSGEEIEQCFNAHVDDLLEEGVIKRKDAKSMHKQFSKLLKKAIQ